VGGEMTNEQQKLQYMYERDGWVCQNCGKRVIGLQPQRAHVLGQGKLARKLFGNRVIDSVHNWKTACCLFCNQKLGLNFTTRPKEAEAWAKKVLEMEDAE